MEATQTTTTDTQTAPKIEKPQATMAATPKQSVYVADHDLVKTYPLAMSNDEINYDLHTTVRKKSAEDYFVNFLPLTALQTGFKMLTQGAMSPLVDAGMKAGEPLGKAAADYQDNTLSPALKFATLRPDVIYDSLTGTTPAEVTPAELEKTYKPWLDLWRESAVGQSATGVSDAFLVHAPAPIAAVPWFVAEFVPDQLLEFGTKPLNWVGAYGVEKFGPILINKALAAMPAPVREVLMKEFFVGEKALAADFETLGIKPNVKTSEVVNAYKNAAKVAHPDAGGSAEEFSAVSSAYRNIMGARGSVFDKLFDLFRGQTEKASQGSGNSIKALLEDKSKSGLFGNQRGSVLIPGPGDLVKIGKEVGKVIKITGQIATVNVAGRAVDVALDQVAPMPKTKDSAVNIENMTLTSLPAKQALEEATTMLGDELQNQQGEPLSHEEVIAKAREADIITKGVSREATLDFQASLLKTRQHLVALANDNELTPEFLDTLKVMSNLGTDIARNLESFKIQAFPEHTMVKMKIIKDLQKLGISSEEILKAAKGVDFKDEQSVAKFYRTFVKPKLPELLDEFVYMNILSSPATHITNAFSNVLQLAGLNPLTKLASGALDFVGTRLTGEDRSHYISEIPDFYKGALNAVPTAFKGALEAMKGKKILERPDVKHLPTLSKLVDVATLGLGKYVTRALEASDIFFRTMIEAGEVEAMSKALGHPPLPKEQVAIQKEAQKRANYYVFRMKPDAQNETGQGKFLSAVDQMTNAVYRLRAVPGFKWFIRFVQTPMNILKQGIEYSPAGIATIPGAKDKTEQAGKAVLGSFVFAGASWLAANNLTTWSAPTSAQEKNDFYAAGLQPYSVRIGDKWVSYSKLGPLAYPLAMGAALHYFLKESPDALSDTEMDKVVDALTGIMKFFSDQSYMQGISDLVGFASGEKSKAISSIPAQLVPLSSLQGWVNNIIDPLRRKAEKGLTVESVVDNIQMKIVGMSQFVPPQIDAEEVPVKKQMREVNAVSPVKVSKVDEQKLAEYQDTQKTKQEMNKVKKELA